MPQASILHGWGYEDQVLEYLTDRQIDKLEEMEEMLSRFPDMGSPVMRDYLSSRYGKHLRKLVMDGYIIVYRHDEDAIRMLALIPGKAIS